MKNEMMKKIVNEHTELRRWIRLDRGHVGKLMLDTSDGDVWADVFLNENDWKIYRSDTIIDIPISDILYNATETARRPLSTAEENQAIYNWCVQTMKPKPKNMQDVYMYILVAGFGVELFEEIQEKIGKGEREKLTDAEYSEIIDMIDEYIAHYYE